MDYMMAQDKMTIWSDENMAGLLVAMYNLIGTVVVFSVADKEKTGRNLFKDVFDDMCGR